MKTELTLSLLKSLTLEKKPVGLDSKGKIIFEDNPRGEPYFVFDAAAGAPLGFALKVAKKKTFVVQRKVEGRTFRATIGSVAEFVMDPNGLEKARAAAAKIGAEIRTKGVNPNVVAKSLSAAEITLGEAFANYRTYLTDRAERPAKPATLKVFDRAARKFEDWAPKKVRTLDLDEIKARFMAGKTGGVVANEQAFRTAYSAVRRAIDVETLAAAAARREPLLTANPFAIIGLSGLYRSGDAIERERHEKMVRNPLNEKLGDFLEALWAKRQTRKNHTGCDYWLLTLLTAARPGECIKIHWADMLTEAERRVCSWVDLDAAQIFFYKTKNNQDHLLPLGPCAVELLRRRQAAQAEMLEDRKLSSHAARKWVFPARNKQNRAGHYSDGSDLLDRIREIAKVEVLNPHDMRRTAGGMMENLEFPESVSKRIMNHDQHSTHNRYTKAEWAKFLTWMVKLEEGILLRSPNVWNSLKPADKSPLPWQPLPEVPEDKPRSGRPPKRLAPEEAAN